MPYELYPEPSPEIAAAQQALTELRHIGDACEQRQFAYPGEVTEFLVPIIRKYQFLPVEVVAEGEDVTLPNLQAFSTEEGAEGIVAHETTHLKPLEQIIGITQGIDGRYSEKRSLLTGEVIFSADIICYVLVYDKPIAFSNGLQITPRRLAEVPLNSRSQLEIVDLKRIRDKKIARDELLKHIGNDTESSEDIDLIVMTLAEIDEEVEMANPLTWVEISGTKTLIEVVDSVQKLILRHRQPGFPERALHFCNSHLPIVNRPLQIICSGDYLQRQTAGENEPLPTNWTSPVDQEQHYELHGTSHGVMFLRRPDQEADVPHLVIEAQPKDGSAPEQIFIPVKSLIEISV